ncbi:nucleotide sugar dehydrogenase [Flavobacteriaceae bacterium]|nr:nucleotide sugar dehydrogenase [Flavobacteriaceae bacterium]
MNIGIIGQGFVGNAVYNKFKNYYNVLTFDLDKSLCNSSFEEITNECKYIFVCLPTPMNKDGSCYIGIVENLLIKLNEHSKVISKSKIVVVKSTIPPGTSKKWNDKFDNLSVVFNPEFLTEANAVKDYENQNRIILGGPKNETLQLNSIFSKVFPTAKIINTNSTDAEMVKYTTNTFLAMKVSFANEIYQICKKVNADYDKVIKSTIQDDRLGTSHWKVPGPDGDFGYGGHCFPKDINALISVAINNNISPKMLIATDEKNKEVRSNKDWENMKGRAVV